VPIAHTRRAGAMIRRRRAPVLAPPQAFVVGVLAVFVAVGAGFDFGSPATAVFFPARVFLVPVFDEFAVGFAGAAGRPVAVWVAWAPAAGAFHG
jgi:hypothetical protein